jgi:regulator of protease activity HflC (stomatin/prohibitin superfamily)
MGKNTKVQAEAVLINDLQEVQTVIALNYRIDPTEANKIYQILGVNYADRVISPTIQESVKASVAKFNAEELITKRETAKSVIANAIRSTLAANDIQTQNVFITDFKFSDAFASQIEQKVVAFQKYLTELNNLRSVSVVANQSVAQAEGQARATAARAGGESQAIKIITSQLRESPEYLMAGHIKMEWTNAVCPREQWLSILPLLHCQRLKTKLKLNNFQILFSNIIIGTN